MTAYKQTELGLIPSDWEVVELGNLIYSITSGVSVNSIDKLYAFSHNYHILKTSCVFNGKFDKSFAKSILPNEVHRAKNTVKQDCIIVSRMNTPALVGEIGYVEQDCPNTFLPDRLWQVSFKEKLLNTKFISFLLSYTPISTQLKEKATGTSNSMKNISKDSFSSLIITIPKSKPEQTAIATALSDTDALLAELEKLLAKKQAIKTATMQQLLTGKTRLPEFAHRADGTPKGSLKTEWGDIPEDWEVVALGDVGNIITGSTPSTIKSEFWNGDIAWITPTDISECKDIYYSERQITEEGLKSIRELPANTLLVTCIASIGKNAILRNRGSCNQQINAVIPNNNFNVDFLYYFFENKKPELKSLAGITATPIISKALFSTFLIFAPDKLEQIAIAQILGDMDNEINALQARIEKLREIKQGMMQNLLTGKIRLLF